mgnify:CR=1 FL=1
MSEKKPGIVPIEYKVLIEPEEVSDKSSGGMFIPPNVQDRQQEAQERGVLIAVSEAAFTGEGWPGRTPKVGEKVFFNKYAGSTIPWKDDDYETTREIKKYRLCNDQDVCAILEEVE